MICVNVWKNKNILAKFKVECAFKQLSAAEDNFIVKIREKTTFSFLHEKKSFFNMQLEKQEHLAKFQPILKNSFSEPRSHLK